MAATLSGTNASELLGGIAYSSARAGMAKKAYCWFALSLVCSSAGGFAGARTPAWVDFFYSVPGVLIALVLFAVIPRIALAVRGRNTSGAAVLVASGLLSGFMMAPLLAKAAEYSPGLLFECGIVLMLVVGYVMAILFASREAIMPGRVMLGGVASVVTGSMMVCAADGFSLLNVAVTMSVGMVGVLVLVTATTELLRDADETSPISAALRLFADTFNVLVFLAQLGWRLLVRDWVDAARHSYRRLRFAFTRATIPQ